MLGITLLKSIDVSSYTFTDCHSSVRDGYYYLVDKSFFSNIQYNGVKINVHIYLYDRSSISSHLTWNAIFLKRLLNLIVVCPVTLQKIFAQMISMQRCPTTLTNRNLKLQQRKVPQLCSKTTLRTKQLIRVQYAGKMVRISFGFGKLFYQRINMLLPKFLYILISRNFYKRY